jgi:hypothetical protein
MAGLKKECEAREKLKFRIAILDRRELRSAESKVWALFTPTLLVKSILTARRLVYCVSLPSAA